MHLKFTSLIKKEDYLPIFLISSLALIMRLLYMFDFGNSSFFPILFSSDSYSNFSWAKDITSGQLIGNSAFMKWPLYPYFLAFLLKVFFNNPAPVYYFQFLLGVLNCILVYLIAKKLFNKTTAIFASSFCAWYAIFIFYESLLVYTSLSLFLNSLFFLFLLSLKNNINSKKLLASGILLGLATLTQANILIFGLAIVPWLILASRPMGKKLVFYVSSFLLGLIMVIGLATLHNYLAEKDILLIQGNTGVNFYFSNNPQSTGLYRRLKYFAPNQEGWFRDARVIAGLEAKKELKTSEVSRFWFKKALNRYIRDNPKRYLKLAANKFLYLFSGQEFIHDGEFSLIRKDIRIFKLMFMDLSIILPLALLGMVICLSNFKKIILLYLIVFILSLSIVPFYVSSRFRIAIVPFLIIFASCALCYVMDKIKEKRYLKSAFFILLFLILFLLSNLTLFLPKKKIHPEYGLASDFHYSQAQLFEQKAEYQKALEELARAELINPDNQEVIFLQGVIYFKLKDLKLAEEKFKQALELYPLQVDAYYNLGLLYSEQGRFSEAREMFNKVVSLDPKDIGAHFELGKLYKREGNMYFAKKEFLLVLQKINPWRKKERLMVEQELASLKR